jgi:hypothetical protein
MSFYELAVLGGATAEQRATLSTTLGELVSEFGLALGSDVIIHDGSSMSTRDKHAAFACAYFGGIIHADIEAASELRQASMPIIPSFAPGDDFGVVIPGFLSGLNGLQRRADDPKLYELALAMLECIGLLRQQRRAFISYRRVESKAAALQLHDLLSARGFDAFLDTHDIRPGDPFQDVLWHRLVDSDVLVMLDTPSYFDSRWTRQEIGRARAKDIQVLRIVWPGHTPTRLTDLAETVYLQAIDLLGADGPISKAAAEAVLLQVERLRSRSIATRYMSVTGKLRADVEKIGGSVDGVGAHRAIALRLPDDQRVWAYPIVGVPTAEVLNDISDKARNAGQQGIPVLVYDHLGIRDRWSAHLQWLDENIRVVRAIKVSEAGFTLATWDG